MCYPCGDWDFGGYFRLGCSLGFWVGGEGEFGLFEVVSVTESANPPWLGEHHAEG